MTKKLKIRFVKFEKALAMQILEQEGKFANSEHVGRNGCPALFHGKTFLRGRDTYYDLSPDHLAFSSNAERDEYLAKVVNWITEEQFTSSGALKVGEMCKFRDELEGEWCEGRLITILPRKYDFRYIFETVHFHRGWSFARYARPLAQRVEPKIDGDVYTWEKEVADER